jgi:hypothetical protein
MDKLQEITQKEKPNRQLQESVMILVFPLAVEIENLRKRILEQEA